MKSCEVKLYALSTCIHCRNTRELLEQCGVEYECVEVDKINEEERREIIEEIKKANPDCRFPMLVVGGKVIIGFRAEEIRDALDIE